MLFRSYGTESGGEEQAPAPVRVKTDRRVVYDDRYPNRDAAIAIYEGIAPPAVIKSVMSKSLKSPEDMPYTYWCKMIEELMAERKRAEAGISVERRDVDPTTLDLHIQPKTRYIIAYSRTLIDLITPSQTWPM